MSLIQDIENLSITSIDKESITNIETNSMSFSLILSIEEKANISEIIEWIGDNNLTFLEVDGQILIVVSDNSAFSKQFIVSGRPPHTFTYTGILPEGLSISSSGLLSGSVNLLATSNPIPIDAWPWYSNYLETLQSLRDSCNSIGLDAYDNPTNLTNGAVSAGDWQFRGVVLMTDGRVFYVPSVATNARIYNPTNDSLFYVNEASSAGGDYSYRGGVLLPDGKIFLSPYAANNAKIYDPVADSYITCSGYDGGQYAYFSSVLLKTGKVLTINALTGPNKLYDPSTNTVADSQVISPGNDHYSMMVLMTDGNVFMVPRNSTTTRIYDPLADTVSNPTGVSWPGADSFINGVLMPDGRIFCTPYQRTSARIYDPVTDTAIDTSASYPLGGFGFSVLLPDGRVFSTPFAGTSARIYDPVTNTVSIPSGTYPGSYHYGEGVILFDGRLFLQPCNAEANPKAIGTANHYAAAEIPSTLLTSAYHNCI